MGYPDSIVIRKYRAQDRRAVNRLCCDTAYFGEPCESFFPDRELLADLTIKYYIDYEPEHTWVAEYEGKVVSYISACFDEARFNSTMFFEIIPLAFIRALIRGKIWSNKTYKLIVYNLKCFFSKEANLTKADHKEFPVHIHQNTKKEFRGRGLGKRLLLVLLDEAKNKKLSGVRFRALRQEQWFPFFENHGFKKIDCKRVKTWEAWLRKKPLYYMEYVKELNSENNTMFKKL